MCEQGPDYNVRRSQGTVEETHHLPLIVLTI